MKWWAGSFFWRTPAVLVIALVASQAASFWLFRQQVQHPRQAMGIGQLVSHLETVHAALLTLPPGAEREFIGRLAEREGIRVFPARGEEPGRPAADMPGMRMLRGRVQAVFGGDADIFVRPGAPGIFNSMSYLELSVDNDFYAEFSSSLFIPHTDIGRFPSAPAEQVCKEGRA